MEKETDQTKQKQYCKNADLLKEILKYRETGVVTNQLGEYFKAIAWHLTGHSNFRQYSYSLKEDFVGAALVKMVKGIDKFNPEISKNPFSYFTQICWNSFVYSCKEYYRQINIKKSVLENYLESIDESSHINAKNVAEMYINALLNGDKDQSFQDSGE